MATIRFAAFEFDPVPGQLAREGRRVPLQEQPARVLAYLIEHSGRTVTRTELIEHLWGDGRHVQFDQGLNYCIRQIRIALDDRVAAPKYVATVGRKGYRWVGPCVSRRASWLRANITRPVPAWSAPASAAAALLVAATLAGPPPPNAGRALLPVPGTDLRTAISALHILSHALIEPGRSGDAVVALQMLWNTVAGRP